MKRLVAILMVIGVLSGAIYVLPWKPYVADQIKAALSAQGVAVSDLTVDAVGLNQITLKDIRIGAENPITLPSLVVDYEPLSLMKGVVEDIRIRDLRLTMRQEKGAWVMSGIQSSGGALIVPDSEAAIDAIPLERLTIESSTAEIEAPFGKAQVPFSVFWDRSTREVLLSAKGVSFTSESLELTVADLRGTLHFKDGVWRGDWSAAGLDIKDIGAAQAKGTWRIETRTFIMDGGFDAPEMKAKTNFTLTMGLDGKAAPKLALSRAELPYAAGKISIPKASFAMDGKTPIRFGVTVENVSLAALMQAMTGQEIAASGVISGQIPVIVKPDGSFTLGKSRLAAKDKGVVSVPASLIPGEGMQIDLTREVLSNFEYDGLSIDVVEEEKGRIAFVLNVSGKNPKVYEGRAVKLNVRLGGDVLEFLQSNMMMWMKPESILQQETK